MCDGLRGCWAVTILVPSWRVDLMAGQVMPSKMRVSRVGCWNRRMGSGWFNGVCRAEPVSYGGAVTTAWDFLDEGDNFSGLGRMIRSGMGGGMEGWVWGWLGSA